MQFESVMDICVNAVTVTEGYTYFSLTNKQCYRSITFLLHGAESFLS
jgi:hypothetical protein